jgi:heme-degrading monooxygenase HmoA
MSLVRMMSCLCLLALMIGTPLRASAAEPTAASGPIHQLRIYEVVDNNRDKFHQRFREHALRIMRRHGFNVVAAWETRTDTRTEFVYLLEWPDRTTMQARWATFMADQEWADIKKRSREQHGPVMGGIQDRVLEATDYSPRRSLLD